MTRLLVVDPGKMTGFGWLDDDRGSVAFIGGEVEHDAFLDWILSSQTPIRSGELTGVLCEGFVVGPRTIQQCPDDRSLWSVKQIGALELACRWADVPFLRCLPSGKNFGTDAKLKKIGWYAPSPGVTGERGHRRDAARHALKYAVDHQIIAMRSLL